MHQHAQRWRLTIAAAVPAAIAAGIFIPALADGPSYNPKYCPKQDVITVDRTTGAYKESATIQDGIDKATFDNAGSGSGDTVIVCPGTYPGNVSIPVGQDNITVRSFDGPHDTFIVGNASPVVSIEARGVTFGGQGYGFTIQAGTGTDFSAPLVGIQLGTPGHQSTANEDEMCPTAQLIADPTHPNCDYRPPAGVVINDQVWGNVFHNFIPAGVTADTVTAIEADNTINATIQQNSVHDIVAAKSTVTTVNGIVAGTLTGTPDPNANADNGFDTDPGTSTNINIAILDNALNDLLDGGNRCTATATAPGTFNVYGILVNGYALDATVYSNLLQNIAHDNANCSVVGIYSNAYGSLENEQTGTLAPINVNVDDNRIVDLGPKNDGTGIYLEPSPPKDAEQETVCDFDGTNCSTQGPPPSSYTVSYNELRDLAIGVDVEALLGSHSFIRQNNFDHDPVGVKNGVGPLGAAPDNNLDATNDWWGCTAGPTGGGGCAKITGSGVVWQPPLRQASTHAGDHAGEHAGEN